VKAITTVGVDLAKSVIVISAADNTGRELILRQFSFAGFGEWAGNLPPCTFGMEACSSAHYWARRLSSYGHTVRLIAGEFVNPFRKSRSMKTDRNDAQAVLTAVLQPNMRFVTAQNRRSASDAGVAPNASGIYPGLHGIDESRARHLG
jgi:transposase